MGDPVRLRQVLINLLSNAVKFTNIGTVKLLASVKNAEDETVTIHFEIKDSGIGMTPEQIEKIFEPFIQADDSVTRRFGGTGLGLAITKNIIELMGGTLAVESMVGVGSRFCFDLTFDLIDDDIFSVSEKIIVNDFEKPNFEGEVLICEDNTLNQRVVCDHLARVGLKTVVAYNGKEGVDIVASRLEAKEKPFDLIFMDIHMPVMDGLDAAAKIAKMGVKTPVIALTANVMSNDLELYKVSGMSDTVGKPFTSQDLWRCLIKYLPVVSYTSVDKRRQMVDDEKIQKQLRTNFVKDNQDILAQIKTAVDTGDIKLAHRLVHTLKSNAGQIGEKNLQEAAAIAENKLSGSRSMLKKEHLPALETELESVLLKLSPLLLEASRRHTAELIDPQKILKLFERLEPMLREKDTGCLEFLDEIYTVPGTEELAQQIEDYNFKQALQTLEVLKRKLVHRHG
jgi:CheY-like chemotaxis protein